MHHKKICFLTYDQANNATNNRKMYAFYIYVFLIGEPNSSTCTRLEEVIGIYHDSVLDKYPRKRMSFVSYFWSGKYQKTVKIIKLITLYYTNPIGFHTPINYRIYYINVADENARFQG
jgi:hypothetical protein